MVIYGMLIDGHLNFWMYWFVYKKHDKENVKGKGYRRTIL
ncbi:hypothetical protein bpmyx0001_42230 [Bacillus pseudomycoides DSM 12442]|nr:hypothetical protein bpmyx0001_42230 [Bacillus pseudomycoides DSM 12442]